jgi:hypothetical protein
VEEVAASSRAGKRQRPSWAASTDSGSKLVGLRIGVQNVLCKELSKFLPVSQAHSFPSSLVPPGQVGCEEMSLGVGGGQWAEQKG